jgi:hypothetical protein
LPGVSAYGAEDMVFVQEEEVIPSLGAAIAAHAAEKAEIDDDIEELSVPTSGRADSNSGTKPEKELQKAGGDVKKVYTQMMAIFTVRILLKVGLSILRASSYQLRLCE